MDKWKTLQLALIAIITVGVVVLAYYAKVHWDFQHTPEYVENLYIQYWGFDGPVYAIHDIYGIGTGIGVAMTLILAGVGSLLITGFLDYGFFQKTARIKG